MICPYTHMGCDSQCKAYVLQTCPFDVQVTEVVVKKTHVCPTCGKSCANALGLSAHMRSHK